MKKVATVQKIYKLICNDFGHKFSFNAKDDLEAKAKLAAWCDYHSYNPRDFKLEETTDPKWIHNEYF